MANLVNFLYKILNYMVVETPVDSSPTKVKFFALYLLSVLLAVVVFASLWQRKPETVIVEAAAPATNTEAGKLIQRTFLLQSRLNELDRLYLGSAGNAAQAQKNTPVIQRAESSFSFLLDSVENEVALTQDEEQKGEWLRLVADFKSSFQNRAALLKTYSQATTPQNIPVASVNNKEVEELKGTIVEKDRTIASLQQDLRNKPVTVVQNSGDGGEARKKLANLQAAYDKLQEQSATLNRAYGVVVQDNRRLLTQLQSKN